MGNDQNGATDLLAAIFFLVMTCAITATFSVVVYCKYYCSYTAFTFVIIIIIIIFYSYSKKGSCCGSLHLRHRCHPCHCCTLRTFSNLILSIFVTVPPERALYNRESASGYYHTSAYYLVFLSHSIHTSTHTTHHIPPHIHTDTYAITGCFTCFFTITSSWTIYCCCHGILGSRLYKSGG